jgi:hypothetical protein
MNAEQIRLEQAREQKLSWKKWGPYLSERQWGTVREDYSDSGDAWNYFSHDDARSRAYRWGEDGLAGISDDRQLLCFSLALWNGEDPILKERLFGLTNSEGNHGEDVKEYYFYLDSTPTHSYLKYLYKYPQAAYPYDDLVGTNRGRGRDEPEYELLDTGAFDQDRYFDVFVEYAKAAPEDILVQITVHSRGPEPAVLHLLPTLWFRNIWSWGENARRPALRQAAPGVIAASHPELGERFLYAEGATALLFTENETNTERLVQVSNRTPYVKDAFHNNIVHGHKEAVNPERTGTKAAGKADGPLGSAFDAALTARRKEADEFYTSVIPSSLSADQTNVMRQALAGMLWSKQFFHYDVNRWMGEHGAAQYKSRPNVPRKRAVAPHVQRRRHLDAGQMGIPVVRGLGPGLPLPGADPGGTSPGPPK